MKYRVPINDLSRTGVHLSKNWALQIEEILTRGQYFNGPETLALRSAMELRLGGQDFIPLANGTDALILAFESLDLPFGSYVAMAPNAGGYGTIAAVRAGLHPIYVDVDRDTAQMSVSCLEQTLNSYPEIRAVIVTHLYGLIGEINQLAQVCNNHNVRMIEDCAQSFGASVDGRSCGTFGDVGTFSFYPTKNLGAIGDAGGITSSDQTIISRIAKLSQYGWGQRYEVELERGFNSRLDEIHAAILNQNLKFIDKWNDIRREIVRSYSKVLVGKRRMLSSNSDSFVAHLAVLVSPNRDSDLKRLNNLGIETSIHYPILDPDQAAWKKFSNTELPVARSLNSSIITLPCFPFMTDDEIKYVCQALANLDSPT